MSGVGHLGAATLVEAGADENVKSQERADGMLYIESGAQIRDHGEKLPCHAAVDTYNRAITRGHAAGQYTPRQRCDSPAPRALRALRSMHSTLPALLPCCLSSCIPATGAAMLPADGSHDAEVQPAEGDHHPRISTVRTGGVLQWTSCPRTRFSPERDAPGSRRGTEPRSAVCKARL
jgi:hypothetical protein